jgi:hypothetical protein
MGCKCWTSKERAVGEGIMDALSDPLSARGGITRSVETAGVYSSRPELFSWTLGRVDGLFNCWSLSVKMHPTPHLSVSQWRYAIQVLSAPLISITTSHIAHTNKQKCLYSLKDHAQKDPKPPVVDVSVAHREASLGNAHQGPHLKNWIP